MSDEEKQELIETVRQIHILLAGNKYDKDGGLVKRVATVEAYMKKDERLKTKIAGGLAVGTPIFVVAYDYILRKIGFK